MRSLNVYVDDTRVGRQNTAPERAVYTAVEARLLRVVQHITLKDMLLRLRDSATATDTPGGIDTSWTGPVT